MNKYQTDEDAIIDFWIMFFLALSTDKFAKFAPLLGCPPNLTLSPDLHQVAKEFSLLVFKYLDSWTPEPPPIIDKATSEETEPLLIAWEYTFSRLDFLGYSEQIYAWGKQIWQYKQRLGQRVGIMSSWEMLLFDWAREPDTEELARPLYSQKIAHELRHQTLDYFLWLRNTRSAVHQLKQNPENHWEDFVFRLHATAAWISNISTFYILLSYWKSILCGKKQEEIAMIQAWGENLNSFLSTSEPYYLLFPLQELADEICT